MGTTLLSQPLFQHPTQVMMIDDNKKTLRSAVDQIEKKFSYIAFTNPIKALEHLKESALPLKSLAKEVISDVAPGDMQQIASENVSIQLAPLRALATEERFTRTVVAVVDKIMEGMDGLDFCRHVRKLGLPVKLILLTGNVGDSDAVKAFNENIIDGFVRKSPDMMQEVNIYADRLSNQAFVDVGKELLGPIIKRFSLLDQPGFADFMQEICEKNNIVEYYLLDSSCSYLLVTSNGQTKVLMIRTDDDFVNAYDLYENLYETVSRSLRERTAFPFTGTQMYFVSDKESWNSSMVPMAKQEALNIYYAVVDYADEPVLSFDQYMNEIWRPEFS